MGFPASPCSNASVAAGASGTFTVTYKVTAGTPSGTVITDTATVNATNQSFGANSATATDVVATAIQADLALSTAAAPPTVLAGNDITYTQTITNNGPASASAVILPKRRRRIRRISLFWRRRAGHVRHPLSVAQEMSPVPIRPSQRERRTTLW